MVKAFCIARRTNDHATAEVYQSIEKKSKEKKKETLTDTYTLAAMLA